MPGKNINRIKEQLMETIENHQAAKQSTLNNAELIESQLRPIEDTLIKFKGIHEGVMIVNNHLQRLEGLDEQTMRTALKIVEQLLDAANQQLLKQEGALLAYKNTVALLKNKAQEHEMMIRGKTAVMEKADKSSINPPEEKVPVVSQPPPITKKTGRRK
jgi:hypothetical protein